MNHDIHDNRKKVFLSHQHVNQVFSESKSDIIMLIPLVGSPNTYMLYCKSMVVGGSQKELS